MNYRNQLLSDDLLHQTPFEHHFRKMKSHHFVNRLVTERNLFSGNFFHANSSQHVATLVILINKMPDSNFEKTLHLWKLQSCPFVHCILYLTEEISVSEVKSYLEKYHLGGKLILWTPQNINWNDLKSSFYVIFAHAGEILHPSVATVLSLAKQHDQPDIIVWNEQQMLSDSRNEWIPHQFLRRPHFQQYSIQHINYIGLNFAVSPALAQKYPYDLFDHLYQNEGHLFHIWLSGQEGVKWHTHPEYFRITHVSHQLKSSKTLFIPFKNTYAELFKSSSSDFKYFEMDSPEQPYHLLPTRSAKNVSIVIPFRNKAKETCQCITSVIQQKFLGRLEIILINNDSNGIELNKIKEFIEKNNISNSAKILDYPYPFNHSRQCNGGIQASQGDVILLLNNDAEFLNCNTLDELTRWALFPGIGTVGCRMTGYLGNIICSGVTAHLTGGQYYHSAFEESTDTTYSKVIRETFANTFACAAMSRSTFEKIGAFNDIEFPNGYNDVEFCLRASQAGYKHIYLGHLEVKHDPGKSRGPCDELLQKILIRQRFPKIYADALFQLESDHRFLHQAKHQIKKLSSSRSSFIHRMKKAIISILNRT